MQAAKKLSIALSVGAIAAMVAIELPGIAQQTPSYVPIPLQSEVVSDTLTDRDIPTGEKGFAKDYVLKVDAENRLEISVSSEAFDTVVSLIGDDGDVIAENDDGQPRGTDSILFVKVDKPGEYIIRVKSFGGRSGGKFTLRVTKLVPVENWIQPAGAGK
ncbi:peptidase domain protein [Thalassoporum mexicanum PCC 7367]|nr:peptidase domain protein [Pseudanabaena sp. PCC 7367]